MPAIATTLPHLWHNADEMEHYLQQEYSMAALAHSLADPQCCWLIAEAEEPIGFAKYACRQDINPKALRVRYCINSIYYLTLPGIATASRFFAPSRSERKRPVKAGYGWKCSPRIPVPAVFMNVRGCST
ncbi:ribosomal-protein-alanine N-acetyltransferase [Klebsiella michiganensis]|nr:ribosomal-protein-alanine N-acetyltransferase [Klebsiella michiganensis]